MIHLCYSAAFTRKLKKKKNPRCFVRTTLIVWFCCFFFLFVHNTSQPLLFSKGLFETSAALTTWLTYWPLSRPSSYRVLYRCESLILRVTYILNTSIIARSNEHVGKTISLERCKLHKKNNRLLFYRAI